LGKKGYGFEEGVKVRDSIIFRKYT